MIALLLAATVLPTAIDAERAFARDAQRRGQWTAFRTYARADARLFIPQPVNAHDFLKGRKDPPVSVAWWPALSVTSCDGRTAINHGPWLRDGGRASGTFTTVWHRAGREWRWSYDGGANTKRAGAAGDAPRLVAASCRGRPHGAVMLGTAAALGYHNGGGRSADGTLVWSWTVDPKGVRHFLAQRWDGRRFVTALDEVIAE